MKGAELVEAMLRPSNAHINKMLHSLAKKVALRERKLSEYSGEKREKEVKRALKLAARLEKGADIIRKNRVYNPSLDEVRVILSSALVGKAGGEVYQGHQVMGVALALLATGILLPTEAKRAVEHMRYFSPSGGLINYDEKTNISKLLNNYAKALRKAAKA